MNAQEFIKLPADHAVEVYLAYREGGNLEASSKLHKAYYDRHGVHLAKLAIETAPSRLGLEATRRGVEAISKVAQLTRDAAKSVLNNWKTCDHCQSRIKSAAKVCRYCQRDLA
ncbi:MAG: hypothetical protein Q8K11_02765 [Phenylobacterium sp.]|uniref:hypothetical protein n=1 Tax=Phenylobacterium sp. TaxID=1871053 RepID=UPI0027312A21|nr:hypothetical protein [Phenylobacterium sp.]MDP2009078.1 hypothetical protein [Phenylobacterium sp.]